MCTRRLDIPSLLVFVLATGSADAFAISSTFDVDKEGWFVESRNPFNEFAPAVAGTATYQAAGGNPGGYICCADQTGTSDFFAAPMPYLGDKQAFVGGTLSFDVRSSVAVANDGRFLVVLEGGGTILYYDASPFPIDSSWKSVSVTLAAGTGWKRTTPGCWPNTCPAAIASDFDLVMSALTALDIRGDWVDGADVGGLDNVSMVPEPGTLLLLLAGLSGLALNCRRGNAA